VVGPHGRLWRAGPNGRPMLEGWLRLAGNRMLPMQDTGEPVIGCDPQGARNAGPEARAVVPMPVLRHAPPPVRTIKLTEQREITAYKWVHPDEERSGSSCGPFRCLTQGAVRRSSFQFSTHLQAPNNRVGVIGGTVTIKNVVIPLEVEYLQAVANERGISRTKLVRVVMQKVIREGLVPQLLDDDDLTEPVQPRYRRFRNLA